MLGLHHRALAGGREAGTQQAPSWLGALPAGDTAGQPPASQALPLCFSHRASPSCSTVPDTVSNLHSCSGAMSAPTGTAGVGAWWKCPKMGLELRTRRPVGQGEEASPEPLPPQSTPCPPCPSNPRAPGIPALLCPSPAPSYPPVSVALDMTQQLQVPPRLGCPELSPVWGCHGLLCRVRGASYLSRASACTLHPFSGVSNGAA